MPAAIVDTGPLVAYLDSAERHHLWVKDRIATLDTPLLVCEPVLVEAMHILKHLPAAQQMLLKYLENGALKIGFRLEEHVAALRALHRKYSDIPMSLADACVVRMAEIHEHHSVFTLDSDFEVYRKNGRSPLVLIHPAKT